MNKRQKKKYVRKNMIKTALDLVLAFARKDKKAYLKAASKTDHVARLAKKEGGVLVNAEKIFEKFDFNEN